MATHQEQTAWLSDSAGVFVTNDRVVRLSGDDAASWLNGQVTADVRSLTPGQAVYALSVSLKGRVHTDLWVVPSAEGLSVVLPESCAERALEAFEKHIIMEDVELDPQPALRVITVQGPKAAQVVTAVAADAQLGWTHYACARLSPESGFDVWVPASELTMRVEALTAAASALSGGALDAAGWAHAHVVLGIPRAGVDFGPETYPQEAGLKARAVSFSKGCYTGQEVVYMLEKRGQVSRRLVQLVGPLTAPAAGATVLDDNDTRIGEVTSATQTANAGFALAYLKRAHSEPPTDVRIAGEQWQVRYVVGASDEGCPIVASA
jgi:folate-binding protein YgfZ